MKNRDNVPEEVVEVFVDTLISDYRDIFGQDPNIKQFTRLVDYFGMEKVKQVMEYLYIKGVNGPREGQKNNPMGYLYVVCKGFKVR